MNEYGELKEKAWNFLGYLELLLDSYEEMVNNGNRYSKDFWRGYLAGVHEIHFNAEELRQEIGFELESKD